MYVRSFTENRILSFKKKKKKKRRMIWGWELKEKEEISKRTYFAFMERGIDFGVFSKLERTKRKFAQDIIIWGLGGGGGSFLV